MVQELFVQRAVLSAPPWIAASTCDRNSTTVSRASASLAFLLAGVVFMAFLGSLLARRRWTARAARDERGRTENAAADHREGLRPQLDEGLAREREVGSLVSCRMAGHRGLTGPSGSHPRSPCSTRPRVCRPSSAAGRRLRRG